MFSHFMHKIWLTGIDLQGQNELYPKHKLEYFLLACHRYNCVVVLEMKVDQTCLNGSPRVKSGHDKFHEVGHFNMNREPFWHRSTLLKS